MYDLIVIGGGPGGYVAAIKAAKLGLKTAIIEYDKFGGTCLNRGCIPAKAMIHSSELYVEALHGEQYGVEAKDVSFDYKKMLEYRNKVTSALSQGVEQLLKANGVDIIRGKGRVCKDKSVEVDGTHYQAENVILANGSKPMLIPIPGIDLEGVLTSDELFKLDAMPESLTIIGGGVIGVEFAGVYAALGCKVTILEALPSLIPNMDKDISQNLKMILKKRGIDIHVSAMVKAVEKDGDGYACRYVEKEKECSVTSQYVICAVGRIPNTEGLFADVELEMERGRIVVDSNFMTSMDKVYAIGDTVKGMQLAHLASAHGIWVVEHIAGHKPNIDLSVVPGCVYTSPEIANVGMSEKEAKAANIPFKTGKFMMSANSKSMISGEERGFIKIIAREDTGAIIGAHMMCARATDMICEFVTAIANNMTAEMLLKGMRAHPTYNEGVGEALEDLMGGAIHAAPKKKR